MAYAAEYPGDLNVVAAGVGQHLRVGFGPFDVNERIVLGETVEVWSISYEAVYQTTDERVGELARFSERWQHHLWRGTTPVAIAVTDRDGSVESVGLTAAIAQSVHTVFELAEKLPDNPIVRILEIRPLLMCAVWAHDRDHDYVAIVQDATGRRFVPPEFLEGRSFVRLLRRLPRVIGIRRPG